MSDKIFYESGNIEVTDKKFIVDSKTYVLSNLTSIDIDKKPSTLTKILGSILIVLGALTFSIVGVILIIIGIIVFRIKTKYSVLLRTAGNENSAYTSTNKDEIIQIIKALNTSVSYKSTDNESKNNNNQLISDELKKLQELKSDGVLTDEEFMVQKEKILNK
jgi:membrane-bound ClpP family serine protease